jgi:hypothetical protein
MQTSMRPQALGRCAAAPRSLPLRRQAPQRRSAPRPRASAEGGSAAAVPPEKGPQKQLTVWQRVKRFFIGAGPGPRRRGAKSPPAPRMHAAPPPPKTRARPATAGDGLDKERLKALGMGAFASYGFISNLNYVSFLRAPLHCSSTAKLFLLPAKPAAYKPAAPPGRPPLTSLSVPQGTALTISWLAFKKSYGVSPLAEGQWPAFLAFYAGMWALQNFAR